MECSRSQLATYISRLDSANLWIVKLLLFSFLVIGLGLSLGLVPIVGCSAKISSVQSKVQEDQVQW